jgi:hypothetical protein
VAGERCGRPGHLRVRRRARSASRGRRRIRRSPIMSRAWFFDCVTDADARATASYRSVQERASSGGCPTRPLWTRTSSPLKPITRFSLRVRAEARDDQPARGTCSTIRGFVARNESGHLSDLATTQGSRHRQPRRGNGGGASTSLLVLAQRRSRSGLTACDVWNTPADDRGDRLPHARVRLPVQRS